MKRLVFLALMGSLSLAHANPFVEGDAQVGEGKAAICAACHGPGGQSNNPLWPNLAGQGAKYIVSQLEAFKAGERKDPVMSAQAMVLSEEDIAHLAVYFAGQEAKLSVASEAAVALAEPLYRGGDAERGIAACAACHGPTGAGNPGAAYPHIAGQQVEYTAKSLRDFRSGERGAGVQGQIMQSVAKQLTDEEITALASYVSGLQ